MQAFFFSFDWRLDPIYFGPTDVLHIWIPFLAESVMYAN